MADPFAPLRRLADTSNLPSLDEEELGRRTKALTEALEEIPDVHSVMREARQRMTTELRARNVSLRRIAAMIGRSPTRVTQILRGETSRAKPDNPAEDEAGAD